LRSAAAEKKKNQGKRSQNIKLKQVEKKEIVMRIRELLLKYLLRDPIFERFTKVFLEKLFMKISPRFFGILMSIISYFKYYSYIA
jgi:hypothetical protein